MTDNVGMTTASRWAGRLWTLALISAAVLVAAFDVAILADAVIFNLANPQGSVLAAAFLAAIGSGLPVAVVLARRAGRSRGEHDEVLVRRVAVTTFIAACVIAFGIAALSAPF